MDITIPVKKLGPRVMYLHETLGDITMAHGPKWKITRTIPEGSFIYPREGADPPERYLVSLHEITRAFFAQRYPPE